MYLSFYGLTEKPFNLTPDVHFLFPSKIHREALVHLLFGIDNHKGFILLSGEVGSGKTTLCRTLLKEMKRNTEVAFVINPFLSELELIKTINEDLGIQTTGKTKKELIDELNKFLLDVKNTDRNVVIIIDEAQNLPLPVLEEIRILGNLETEKEKLLQIVLVGQPELRKTLRSPQLKQLNQRIAVRCHLRALTKQELEHYIYHRLQVAGSDGNITFTRGAISRIYQYSSGIPRLINVICDHCLLAGYVENTKNITASIVRRAVKEISGSRYAEKQYPLFSPLRILAKVASAIALLVVLAIAGKLILSTAKSRPQVTPETAAYNQKTFAQPKTRTTLKRKSSPAQTPKTAAVIMDQRTADLKSKAAAIPSLLLRAVDLDKAGYLGSRIAAASTKTDNKPSFFGGTLSRNTGPVDSGSVALVEELLKKWSVPKNTITRVTTAIGSSFNPDTDLVYIYELGGMGAVQTICDVSFLVKMNTPALIQVKDPRSEQAHYLLLHSIIDGEVVLYTPQHKINTNLDKLEEIFTGRTIFVADNNFLNPSLLNANSTVSLQVRKLQDVLKKHGVFHGNLNGWFTADTKQAVIDFQKTQRLPTTGMVDVKTKLMLYFLLTDIEIPRLNQGA